MHRHVILVAASDVGGRRGRPFWAGEAEDVQEAWKMKVAASKRVAAMSSRRIVQYRLPNHSMTAWWSAIERTAHPFKRRWVRAGLGDANPRHDLGHGAPTGPVPHPRKWNGSRWCCLSTGRACRPFRCFFKIQQVPDPVGVPAVGDLHVIVPSVALQPGHAPH
jgi:hypothetical protein